MRQSSPKLWASGLPGSSNKTMTWKASDLKLWALWATVGYADLLFLATWLASRHPPFHLVWSMLYPIVAPASRQRIPNLWATISHKEALYSQCRSLSLSRSLCTRIALPSCGPLALPVRPGLDSLCLRAVSNRSSSGESSSRTKPMKRWAYLVYVGLLSGLHKAYAGLA